MMNSKNSREAKIEAGKIWQVYPDAEPNTILFEGSKTACKAFQRDVRNVVNPRAGKVIWEAPSAIDGTPLAQSE